MDQMVFGETHMHHSIAFSLQMNPSEYVNSGDFESSISSFSVSSMGGMQKQTYQVDME
jgi:UDP-2,3-diacylglucosamine pyrophosphatase LpxH